MRIAQGYFSKNQALLVRLLLDQLWKWGLAWLCQNKQDFSWKLAQHICWLEFLASDVPLGSWVRQKHLWELG